MSSQKLKQTTIQASASEPSLHGIYGKPVAVRVYDFGQGAAGALLNTTQTSYKWQSDANYLTFNLLNTPSLITVLNGASSQVAQTQLSYDETLPSSSQVNTSFNLNPANGNFRGNVTTEQHWLNGTAFPTPQCPVSVTNSLLTLTRNYLDTGLISRAIDACGHNSTFQYSPTPSLGAGAYLSTSCNHLGQCSNFTYDFNSGATTSAADPNSATTSQTYDNVGRLKSITYPDQGESDFYYPDAVTVEKKVVINRSQNLWADGFFYFDGLGRTTQTRLVALLPVIPMSILRMTQSGESARFQIRIVSPQVQLTESPPAFMMRLAA